VTASPRLRVRIERLVIDGPPGLRMPDLASALTAELERLATTRVATDELAERLGAPADVVLDVVADPEAGGRAIAAAVYAGLPEVARG
jgi:hypothetical protein